MVEDPSNPCNAQDSSPSMEGRKENRDRDRKGERERWRETEKETREGGKEAKTPNDVYVAI